MISTTCNYIIDNRIEIDRILYSAIINHPTNEQNKEELDQRLALFQFVWSVTSVWTVERNCECSLTADYSM
jgi:hypothetical protein